MARKQLGVKLKAEMKRFIPSFAATKKQVRQKLLIYTNSV